jgi:hypothetical protein
MEPVDPAVFVGRDPQWREAWEERLDAEGRRRVRAAVTDGSRLDDAVLEPYVYGLIARRRRQLRWRVLQGVFTLAIVSAWVVATTVIRPSLWSWFYIPLLVACLTVLPLALLRERHRLDRAALAQTSSRRQLVVCWASSALRRPSGLIGEGITELV